MSAVDNLYQTSPDNIGPAEREVIEWCERIEQKVSEHEHGITFDHEHRAQRRTEDNRWKTYGR